jgi:hypothetical protein
METLMPGLAFRPLALIGLFTVTALLGACGDNVSPSAAPVAKSACGNTPVANTHMSCPPGTVSPAS